MTQLKELKRQAKERGIKGYSVLKKDELILALQGKPVPKRLRKNQVSVGTQTDFPICNECFKADAERRQNKVINDGDMIVDAETGEVLEYDVDYGFRR